MSTTFNVLQNMSTLATAENNLVAAMTAYEQSKVQLEVVTGRTLDDLGISIGDAESGKVTPHATGSGRAAGSAGDPSRLAGAGSGGAAEPAAIARNLLQLGVLPLGLLHQRQIGIGGFPDCEQVLVGGAGLGLVPLRCIGAGQVELGQHALRFRAERAAKF